jgi:hypothetical protein
MFYLFAGLALRYVLKSVSLTYKYKLISSEALPPSSGSDMDTKARPPAVRKPRAAVVRKPKIDNGAKPKVGRPPAKKKDDGSKENADPKAFERNETPAALSININGK